MAIIPMKKITVVGLEKARNDSLLALQKANAVHVIASSRQSSEVSENGENAEVVERIKNTLSLLKPSDISPLSDISWNEACDIIHSVTDSIAQIVDKIRDLENLSAELKPWGDFDLAKIAELERTAGLHTQFFIMTARQFSASSEMLKSHSCQVIRSDAGNLYVVAIGSEKVNPQAREFQLPEMRLSDVERMREEKSEELEKHSEKLKSLSAYIPLLENELQFRQACLNLTTKQTVFVLQGWVPADQVESVLPALNGISVASQVSDPLKGERVPTLRRNKDLVAGPGEMLSDIYSQPQHNEWDPSIMLMVWFGFFFGICVGDAGYGLMFLLMWFVMKMKIGSTVKQTGKRFLNMLFWLSLSTVVMGVATGTIFGVDVTAMKGCPKFFRFLSDFVQFKNIGALLGLPFGEGMDFESYKINVFMVLAIYIGAMHLSAAHMVTAWKSFRDKEPVHALGPIFTTALIWFGIVAYKTGTPWLINTSFVLAALSIIFVGVSSFINDGPVSGVINGVFAPIQTFGDLMSYLRLFALGLSSGLLGAAFNSITGMVVEIGEGKSIVVVIIVWIVAGVIWCFAHLLNVALAIMGGTVHGLRLNMLEFYRWCFSGDGLKYSPFHWNKLGSETSKTQTATQTSTNNSELTSIKGE